MGRLLALVGGALILSSSACGTRQADPPGRGQAMGETDGPALSEDANEADVGAVKKLASDFLAGWEAKKPEVANLYADNAYSVSTDSPPVHGRAAIAQMAADFAKNPATKFDGTNVMTVVSAGGDLAYTQGTYTLEAKDPEGRAVKTSHGYYILVYRKDRDGRWKVAQDVSSRLP